MMQSGMSAREEQPATIPPPAGEDDAYSAATKVGAMPAEVMARLREEGLLPEQDEPPRPVAPRPPLPPLLHEPLVEDNAPVPTLYSTVPPSNEPPSRGAGVRTLEDLEESEKTEVASLAHIEELQRMSDAPGEGSAPVPTSATAPPTQPPQPQLGTSPIAFHPPSFPMPALDVSSGASQQPPAEAAPPALVTETPISVNARELGGSRLSKGQMIGILIALMVLLIGGLFAMALISQRG